MTDASTDHEEDEATSEEKFEIDDIMLAVLLLTAPAEVKNTVVGYIRTQISGVAADAAEELIRAVETFGDLKNFTEYVKNDMDPKLMGPTGKRTHVSPEDLLETLKAVARGEVPVHVARINDKGEIHLMDPSTLAPEAFAEVTPNCGCPRCQHIKDLESKGLRLRNDGSTVAFDRLN